MAAIVYLHGFNSAPASIKGQALQRYLGLHAPNLRFFLPALPHRPAQAIALVSTWLDGRRGSEITIIGSSLGGFYATWLAERYATRAVVINPAVRPYDDLRPYLGMQKNLYTDETYEVTPSHFAELRALGLPAITRPERYFLLVQSGDEVLDYRQAVAFYRGAWQYVRGGGDHAFRDFEAELPAIVRFATTIGESLAA